MSEKIEPALTPEEWADFDCPQGMVEFRDAIRYYIRYYHRSAEVDDNVLHAAAAKALHGQPFGFTREKLVALLALIERLDGHMELRDEDRSLVDWHTDRIAALLPPEVPHGK